VNQLLPTTTFIYGMLGIAAIIAVIALWKTKRIDVPFFLVLAFIGGAVLTVIQVGGLKDPPAMELPDPMSGLHSGTERPEPSRPQPPDGLVQPQVMPPPEPVPEGRTQ
jgi:hypothetical protein